MKLEIFGGPKHGGWSGELCQPAPDSCGMLSRKSNEWQRTFMCEQHAADHQMFCEESFAARFANMHNDEDEIENFEAWFEQRKKESWAKALLPGENKPCPQNWGAAYKPYFREAWLARAKFAA